jgi:hypothetical protein
MADHMLAVSIEADGDDVHAFLHWGEMWNHLPPIRKAQIIHEIGNAMSDACDDVAAESRAALVADIVERVGLTPVEALLRVEQLERVIESMDDMDGIDGWGEDDA